MTKFSLKSALWLALSFLFAFSLQSCWKDDISDGKQEPDPVDPDQEEIFDFQMKEGVDIRIDYRLGDLVGDGNYQVLFSLYGEIPYTYDAAGNRSPKEGLAPLFSGWTDQTGKYSGTITLPSALETLYLTSNHFGALNLVSLPVVNAAVDYNQDLYLEGLFSRTKTRAGNEWEIPTENWETLGNWDGYGEPDYLLAKNHTFYSDFLTDMYYMFAGPEEGRDNTIWKRNPEYFRDDVSMDIHLIKDTKINMVYLQSEGMLENVVGYYVYETNNPPANAAEIQKYLVAFPRLTRQPLGWENKPAFPLVPGNQIELKFPSADGFISTFPAGYSIGFFLAVDGYKSGNITIGNEIIYTTKSLNSSASTVGKSRAVALYEEGTKQMIALGFEDYPGYDQDFNDALFSVFVEVPDAINTDEMKPLPPKEEEDVAVSEGSGVVLFEDLWPSQGDYDINDVVVRYESVIERDKNNKIARIVDTFTPLNSGGSIVSGFGYQYDDVSVGQVKSVVIDYGEQVESSFMGGAQSEPGQTLQTMILIDDIHVTKMGMPIVVTTEFAAGQVDHLAPPYNPFIISRSDKGRDHEIHLINKRPTLLMNYDLLGTGMDKSDPDRGIYYVAEQRYAFALDVPKLNYQWVLEGHDIRNAYPEYSTWVESNGMNNKDWYENPDPSLVEEY